MNFISAIKGLLRASGLTWVIISLVLFLLPGGRALFAASETNSSGAQMDFNAYWAAARLLLDGQDPYSPASLFEIQQKVGLQGTEPLVMWNPPWTFAVTLPFGLFDYSWSQLLWLTLGIVAVLFASKKLWQIYSGSDDYSRIPWFLALTFFPTILVLLFGQMSPIILLGLTAFLTLVQRQQCMAAGAVLAIVAIKPHFIYLFWIVLILWIWHQAQWRILLGAVLAGLATATLPLLFDPAVYTHYFDLYRTEALLLPLDLPAPTLRNALKIFLAVDSRTVEHLSTIVGLVWVFAYWQRHKNHWNWNERLPLILIVSIVTSAYTWTFDQVVLLPAIFQAAVWMRERAMPWHGKAAAVLYCVVDLSYLFMKFWVVHDLYYFWLAPAMLIIYLMLQHAHMSANR